MKIIVMLEADGVREERVPVQVKAGRYRIAYRFFVPGCEEEQVAYSAPFTVAPADLAMRVGPDVVMPEALMGG